MLVRLFAALLLSALVHVIPATATMVNCPDTTGNHLNYTQSTNLYACGTSIGTTGTSLTLDGIFTLADTTGAVPTVKFDANASTSSPQRTAPFSFRSTLSDDHQIGIVPYLDVGTATVATTKGGVNVLIGFDTPIASGKKGDFYGYTTNITSSQADVDRLGDGVLGLGFNITVQGGIRANGYGGVLTTKTVAPSNVWLHHTAIDKRINGETNAYGMSLGCDLTSPATANCNGPGILVGGGWVTGIQLSDTGPGAWTQSILLSNTSGTNQTYGIRFNDSNMTTGISMNGNTVEGASMFSFGTATLFAALGTPGNGTMHYCSDCAPTARDPDNFVCVGAGTGALAVRLNAVWKCFS